MPVYNGSEFLGEAIESILNQTFNKFEFLIIDDGSTDQSIEQIKSYNDERIRLIPNKKNIGQSASLNKGIKMARGDYIAIMDQDDISIQDRLKVQFEFMENHSNIDVCGSWLELIGTYDGIVKYETKSERIKMNLLTNVSLAHSAVMIRKSTLIKYDLNYNSNLSIAQDYDLWVRMFEHCSFANIPEPLLKYRIHEKQNSKSLGEQNIVETNRVLTNLLKKMGIQPDDSDLIIHKKFFTGHGIDSLLIAEVFKYLRRLRNANLDKQIFNPVMFNEFLKIKWRRFMLYQKNKLLYWLSVPLFFRPVNFLQFIENHLFYRKKDENRI